MPNKVSNAAKMFLR